MRLGNSILFIFIITTSYCVQAQYPLLVAQNEFLGASRVKFSWKAENANFIEGGSESYFIAVGANGISKVNNAGYSVFRKKTSEDNLVHQVPIRFSKENFSISYRGMISTNLPASIVKQRIFDLLQGIEFTPVEGTAPDGNNGILIYTHTHSLDKSLCDEGDCSQPIHKRRIIRRVAYTFWLERLSADSAPNSYQVYIIPSIQRNFQLQDYKWENDPDTFNLANRRCRALIRSLHLILSQQ